MMEAYTDKEIIEYLKNREEHIVCYLKKKYFPLIRLMINKKVDDNNDAKDIFHEVLVIIISKIDSGEFVVKFKFHSILLAMCKNLWLVEFRKRHFDQECPDNFIDLHNDFSENYDRKLYWKIFRENYRQLDKNCQTILKLSWREASLEEIAKEMNITYSYAKKLKCECNQKFIENIKLHPEYYKLKQDYEP
jgi:DNA-directed RNA polymerase specialized sigma24 family protein